MPRISEALRPVPITSGPHPSLQAFTLVELLVAVTIIVVLLAMLSPAVEKAVYQAELAACAARLHGLAVGVTQYTIHNARLYPTPKGASARHHTVLTTWGWDMRPLLQSYVSINGHLLDPLAGKIDLEGSKQDGSIIFTGNQANYSLWFDWRWSGYGASEQGMRRYGDRFTWTGSAGLVRRFSLLAADWIDDSSTGYTMGGHPDDAGLLQFIRRQDENPPWWNAPGQTVTLSWWQRTTGDDRGLIDRNFAHDDGSVRRFTRQPWGDGPATPGGRGPGDSRMVTAPVFAGPAQSGEWPARKTYLPVE